MAGAESTSPVIDRFLIPVKIKLPSKRELKRRKTARNKVKKVVA